MKKAFSRRLIYLCLGLGLALGTLPCLARKKGEPPAPLPEAVISAHKAFVKNNGENEVATDEFSAQMKRWARFELVASAAEADIVMELHYAPQKTADGKTADPELTLNIYDPGSQTLLWSDTDYRHVALREKNREKETLNAADRLADDLRLHIDLGQ